MFHEIRFPSNISFGSQGGPERLTDIVTPTARMRRVSRN